MKAVAERNTRPTGSTQDATGQVESVKPETVEGFQVVPFSRFQHQAVDWLALMHRRHTAHILMEADITHAREAMREYRDRTGEDLSLTAFITACFARAVGENPRMQAYRKGRTGLILFDDVDATVIVEHDVEEKKGATPHIIRSANTKGIGQIEHEVRAASTERAPVTLWLPFWLLLPASIRTLTWRGLLNNPSMRKRLTGTVAVSSPGTFGDGPHWSIPLTAYTLSLELGGTVKKPGVVNGDVKAREYLCMTLSVDDDMVDGTQAARFAARLRELIEGGMRLSESDTTPVAPAEAPRPAPDRTAGAITAIKWIHTLIFAGIGSCVLHIVYSGFTGRVTRPTLLSMATVTTEGVIYSRNGFKCPLADLAEDLGAGSGTVGDIYLPKWFSDRLPYISSVMLALSAAAFGWRRLSGSRRQSKEMRPDLPR